MSTTTPPRSALRRRGAQTKGDAREERILAATHTLLSQHPIGEVTIDEIASAAGISRTSFYFYFPSKQAVLAALLDQTWNEFTSTHEWFDSAGPHPEGLRRQLEGVAEIWRTNGPIMTCASQAGGVSGDAQLQDFVSRAQQRFVERLADKIERDRALGLAPEGTPATELATLIAIMRDGRLSETTDFNDCDAVLDALAATIERMIYGRVG